MLNIKASLMNTLKNYHIRVTGPSGAGSTYFSERLAELEYPTVDADKIENLGKFVNKDGHEVEYNHEGDIHWLRNNIWIWDISVLEKYLKNKKRIIVFGGATNANEASELFDYIFYFQLRKKDILANLMSKSRANPYGKTDAQQEYASFKIYEFYNNIPSGWIPLVSRKAIDLIAEIERHINAKLVK